MAKEINEENQSKGGSKLKIGIIIVGLIAVIQLGILFVVFLKIQLCLLFQVLFQKNQK